MSPKNLICVVVDRLHTGMIGAYGNSWIHTRAIDELACQSFVFDQALIDSPRLDHLYRAYWFGLPAGQHNEHAASPSLPRLLRAAGIHTALVTDEAAVNGFAGTEDFDERLLIESPAQPRSATDTSETGLARLFDAAAVWLRSAPQPFCLWVHARGMAGSWDAPCAMRRLFADEEDPDPLDFVDVPDRWLPEEYDPDVLLGIVHAYAGQISLLDECLGEFLKLLDEGALAGSTQVTCLAARGYPLGEHRRIGACDESLYNETSSIAWLMRFPDGLGRLARSPALVQPPDLGGTLLDWLAIEHSEFAGGGATSLLDIVRGETDSIRQAAHLISSSEQALRTPAWLLRQPNSGPPELFAKPGDRWEVNEVARLCPEIAADLQAVLARIDAGEPALALEPLADELTTQLD